MIPCMRRLCSNTFTAVYKKVAGGYTVWIEEMPNVISQGKTRREAEANIKDALALMLETNRIMSHQDAVENVKRSVVSLPVPAA